MAMVNVNSLLNGKDSRWLQLEVCREYQRNKCTRSDTECKFAHPPPNVEVQNGRVTACFDSMKGRCNRDKPPCKYFHPPQQLKDQLLINGRNHLALKNALLHQMGFAPGQQTVISNQIPSVDVAGKLQFPTPNAAAAVASIPLGQPQLGLMANPYFQGISPLGNSFNTYFANAQIMPAAAASLLGADPNNPLSFAVQQSLVAQQQKMARINDRIESQNTAVGFATLNNANQTPIDVGRKRPHDPSDDLLMAFPGMVPYKRVADDKSGVPVYQQNAVAAAAYQQLLQPFVPVTCEYRLPATSSAFSTTSANAAASAYTGITLNKPTTPSTPAHSAAAAAMAAAAAASMPRYHTSTAGQFNQAFTHHFFPSLAMAAMRPNLPGFPSLSIPSPVASARLSELLAAAQQFSNFTNHNGNLSISNSNSNISNSNSANGLNSNGSVVGHTVHSTTSNSVNNFYVNEIGNDTDNNGNNHIENKNGPNVVVPHNNNCEENLQ